ncbi:MAG: orotidine-5'-phosphate decarboxylase [Hydrogenovibrio sp.]
MPNHVISDPKVIVALDFACVSQAHEFVAHLTPGSCRLKVGKELFASGGPQLVERLVAQGFDVFLDLKYHDIPNTVANACKVAADLGVWMLNVHALGGRRMMEAAKEAVSQTAQPPLLIGVTILTSMAQADLTEIGLTGTPADQVFRLAGLAKRSGLDGVVCSAHEAAALRSELGADFCLVTPGIRPADSAQDDQRRIMTPNEAIQAGSSYLVIGRPITQAKDPVAALDAINRSLA